MAAAAGLVAGQHDLTAQELIRFGTERVTFGATREGRLVAVEVGWGLPKHPDAQGNGQAAAAVGRVYDHQMPD